MARLEVWKEGRLVEEIALSEAGEYMAGRLDGSAIQTDHISCSRRHALFTMRPDGTVSVMDLGSAQGTAVDGVELRPHVELVLTDLSKITFGTSTRSYLLRTARGPGPAGGAGSGIGGSACAPLGRVASADEKRARLWGGKKRAAGGVSLAAQASAAQSASSWAGAAGALEGDAERQERFLAMMGAKRHRTGGHGGGSGDGGGDADGDDAGGGNGGDGDGGANAARGGGAPLAGAEASSVASSVAASQERLFDSLEGQYHRSLQQMGGGGRFYRGRGGGGSTRGLG